MKSQEITQVLHLQVGQSKVLRTAYPITRISVADPEIADIILISEKELYAKRPPCGGHQPEHLGQRPVHFGHRDGGGGPHPFEREAAPDLPGQKIAVQAAGDTVVLSGEVTGPVAQETALSLASSFGGGKKEKVVNLLHIGGVQQVMVEVRLAEIDRTVFDQMGINWIRSCLPQAIFLCNRSTP